MKANDYPLTLPPVKREGKGWKAYSRPHRPAKAQPVPYAQALTFTAHRDPLTGRYAPKPGQVQGRAKAAPLPPMKDEQVSRRVIEWEDGSREVIGVRVKLRSARAARLRGELPARDLRELEAGLADELLNELNPAARQAWELEQMHAAHNSAKAQRGAVSRVRNAAARLEDAKRRGALPPPAFEWGHSVTLDPAQLAALLEAVQAGSGPVTLSLRKYSGESPRLEVRRGTVIAARILEGT